MLVFVALFAAAFCQTSDPSYDHQTVTYVANHSPVSVSGVDVTFKPFFSPDYSAALEVDLINSAQATVDVGTPSFSSWDKCTPFSGCQGCTPTDMRNESFPIFGALVNALHRGVAVRVLTNDYDSSDCEGKVGPLAFLKLNGAQVGYYTTTTFIHAKLLVIDAGTSSRKAAVSSVNYSKTSFVKNREAGAVLSGDSAAPLIAFIMSVFNADLAQALEFTVNQTYSKEAMDIITRKTEIKLYVPGPPTDSRYYVTPFPTDLTEKSDVTVTTSPDYAQARLVQDVNAAREHLMLHMYQINDPTLCQLLITTANRGVNVTLLVSSRIYDKSDCQTSNVCYNKLVAAGLSIQKTPYYYEYSHQKVWVVDTENVGWSTGNWSPTDYPVETTTPANYPPNGQAGWAITNRDYTVHAKQTSGKLASIFRTTLTQDYIRGDAYSRNYPVTCGF